jgi:hypothetical protein
MYCAFRPSSSPPPRRAELVDFPDINNRLSSGRPDSDRASPLARVSVREVLPWMAC